MLAWLERRAGKAHQREIERYLSQALNAADLERRMRSLMWRGRAGF
jgi:hypothetical protein